LLRVSNLTSVFEGGVELYSALERIEDKFKLFFLEKHHSVTFFADIFDFIF
jgi:hypothetical protein